MEKHKVLIIKTGYSEVLDKHKKEKVVSYGDVLRVTPLLHLYKNDHVTWITDEKAIPLLKGNNYINRLLVWNLENAMHLLREDDFDTIINLEKNHDIGIFSNRLVKTWRRYGFRFDEQTNSAQAYDRAFDVLSMVSRHSLKKENNKTSQELLFGLVGKKWNGEEYILGYKPKTNEKFDIGLNSIAGSKWPIKSWPKENWDNLEKRLNKDGFNITKQKDQGRDVLENLNSYIDWINSCKNIISIDSLGLHIAIALKKNVLGLFGPTPHKEFHFYNRGKAILPKHDQDCIPCFNKTCKKEECCMEDISVKRVYQEMIKLTQ
ncbi:glycosyl transferase [Candidatus Pacearchaeota archaeon]|nr:glycosyl transferase [Candidatus Pacearchaeota archaeon]|tara:strand:- start:2576 stop:3532 length:957 start_codon:yes stop_codon:yes gene_type:complete